MQTCQCIQTTEALRAGQLSMSAIAFAELMNGAKKSARGSEFEKLNALAELLEIRPFDKKGRLNAGDVRSRLEKGEMIGGYDLLIAAHALSLDLTLR
jgi:tRNA(fMet)-specific endonuclease VapC